jgi:hypothetical protein
VLEGKFPPKRARRMASECGTPASRQVKGVGRKERKNTVMYWYVGLIPEELSVTGKLVITLVPRGWTTIKSRKREEIRNRP